MTEDETNSKHLNHLIDSGSDIVGSIAGAAIGLLGGPAGALVGAATGPILTRGLKKLGKEFKDRHLTSRQETRVGAVLAAAISRMSQLHNSGNKIRNDSFFSDDLCEFNEVAEGVMLSAQAEFEEKKVTFLGNLLAGIAYSPSINREYANFLNKLASELTYRQLILLNIFSDSSSYALKSNSYVGPDGKTNIAANLTGVLTEIKDLESRSLINCGSVLFAIPQIVPSSFYVEGAGKTLAELMKLKDLPKDGVQNVVEILK
ncbi:MAG: hypothetical protein AB8G05_05610 [Oligoflexales bacterium]